jgi:hypothetical protein
MDAGIGSGMVSISAPTSVNAWSGCWRPSCGMVCLTMISGLITGVAWRPTASPATMWDAWNNSATVSPWMLEQSPPGSLFGLSGESQETCGPGA